MHYRLLDQLDRHERFLRQHCTRLAARAAAGERLEAAEAWLVDNYTFLHSQIREIREGIPRRYFRDLPRAADGDPCIYGLVVRLVAESEAGVDLDYARAFFEQYQRETVLTLAELWAIPPLLKLALIDTVCRGEAVRNAIQTLRKLEAASWRDFIEAISVVDRVLHDDPVYGRMDFETRDRYRHAVEAIARKSRLSEEGVARTAIEMAEAGGKHVGYYLVDRGREELRHRAGHRTRFFKDFRTLAYAYPNAFYIGGIASLTLLITGICVWLLAPTPPWYVVLLLVAASQPAVAVMNPLVTRLLAPRRLPRMDFDEGIPDDCRTFVVVPTLLLSRAGVERLLENLEIHYLANRDPNLLFALLTDFADSPSTASPQDWLLELCDQGIRTLNARHAGSPFYLFHRGREWNAGEAVWMGRERKRGKLNDFNEYLLGLGDAFQTKTGELDGIGRICYVLTLDSDTQLPRDTARKLIATMAHPLNQPVFDPKTGIVCQGYGLMQPRVSISMESAGRSRLARIFSGQTGFDPYTTAVSDVYQDLYGQATFTGKGIYDLHAFHKATDGRFPDNALLSHDLIEGEHTRAGLVTDLEVIDDYPATYEAYSKRKHRWVRGDWQIALWLWRTVPCATGRLRNPLPLLSRWKILDNLRRSLVEPALFLLLVAGWLSGQGSGPTFITLGLMALPAYTDLLLAAIRIPPRRYWRTYARDVGFRFAQAHLEVLIQLVFLAHQAFAMMDAVVRTLIRRFITHRRLLEWESAAQAEAASGHGLSLMGIYLYGSPLAVLVIAIPFEAVYAAGTAAVLILESWIFAPLVARWVDGRPAGARKTSASDIEFLHDSALRTWRYFVDFSRAEEHWLVPDNVQEEAPAVAQRTSPTNLGLELNAIQAAREFGYLTTAEMAAWVERPLRSISRLERHRGHFFNWYDTRTLEVLDPRYISTVDSGNMAASLVTVKQGCLELVKTPIIEPAALAGLRDHCLRLRNALPRDARGNTVMRLIASLQRQLEYRPTDLFFWEGVLSEARTLVDRLGAALPRSTPEARYWLAALAERAEAVLRDLAALAPWLADPFERELRLSSADPRLSDLLGLLNRVPPLAEVPAHCDQIEKRIHTLLASDGLPNAIRRTLGGLLEVLPQARQYAVGLIERLEEQAAVASGFVQEMDFRLLFDRRRKLLRIGCDVGAGTAEDSYYDLLASEARTAVFLAIAKGDVPREAWFRLGRKLTAWRGHRTLLSWSGTMFEYLMPCLFMENHEHTLLGQSLRASVAVQQLYAAERGIPWGISEAAFSARDSVLNYQYQAFGVPFMGMKRRLADDLVVAPYASMLALLVDRPAATHNLRYMASEGWTGTYGFYESIDFTPERMPVDGGSVVVRCYMAHHQAMGLLAFCNVLCHGAIRRRFHADPLVQATGYLLHERIPTLPDALPEDERLPETGPLSVTEIAERTGEQHL